MLSRESTIGAACLAMCEENLLLVRAGFASFPLPSTPSIEGPIEGPLLGLAPMDDVVETAAGILNPNEDRGPLPTLLREDGKLLAALTLVFEGGSWSDRPSPSSSSLSSHPSSSSSSTMSMERRSSDFWFSFLILSMARSTLSTSSSSPFRPPAAAIPPRRATALCPDALPGPALTRVE